MPTSRAALLGVTTYIVCQATCVALFALLDVEVILVAGAFVAIGASIAVYRRAIGDRPDAPDAPSPRVVAPANEVRPWKAPLRKVMLREERTGRDGRFLWAYVDDSGRLHIDGQDLGPGTAPVSSDGEYEWFSTIAAADVPRVVALLGGQPGDDVLDVLERGFTGAASYDLEARLRASDIPVEISTWSG